MPTPSFSSFDRRSFLRFAAIASAGATLPILSEAHLARAAILKAPMPGSGAVLINARENPLGPCAVPARQSPISSLMAAVMKKN